MDRQTFEIDASRARFESETARRDAVRSTMAIPLAALSFAAFGFGAIVRNLVFATQTPAVQFLSFASFAFAIAALFLFVSALTVFRHIDYVGFQPYPGSQDVETQYQAIHAELIRQGVPQAQAEMTATQSAWRSAKRALDAAAERQETANRKNLTYQNHMLSYLLWGLGCLILSLSLVAAVQVLVDL